MNNIYQFKITIVGSKPPIWRRVLVPSNFTLIEFHNVIQACFDWQDCHLYDFDIFGEQYYDEIPKSLSKKLSSLHLGIKDKFKYTYDFGDNWLHTVLLEKILQAHKAKVVPYCVTGKMAAPPEDCGGIWGYVHKLEILTDKKHPEYEEISEWMGDDFLPELFDLKSVNEQLHCLVKKSGE